MSVEIATVSAPTSMEESVPFAMKKARDSTKWLHKTKLCVYSVQGTCRLGSKCSFAHSACEVQDAPDLHKTQLCTAFAAGNCSNENCSFAHGEEELRLSPNFKNKLCKWFEKGKCRNGADCGFAHGLEQLRGERPADRQNDIGPPPGLGLEAEEKACTQERLVLDLDTSLLDTKTPASLEQQVEGMSATIVALQAKMDEMVLRTQVGSMKQYLGQLSSHCAELEAAVNQTDFAAEPQSKMLQTPLKTPLRSRAAPFQPSFAMDIKANSFVPSYDAYHGYAKFEGCESYWLGSDDSTSMGSGGFSSD